jgi:sugar/nucleoside kinase (ribokinase family)
MPKPEVAAVSIVVVGSVALDSIETPFGKVESALGGSATHFSCAASFFSQVALVGVVGSDFPDEHVDFLTSRGIDTSGLEIVEGATFAWEGFYDYDLNTAHSRKTCLNVFETFHPKLTEEHRASSHVFLANIDPDLQREVLDQVANPELVVLDTMNFWIENKRESLIETLSRVDIALLNDAEARELCGTYSLLDAARMIRSWGPKAVVLKKGEHGALLFTEDSHFAAPAFPLEEIRDPTGAGDSFAGGFVGYLASQGEIDEPCLRRAVIHGSVMASYNVEGFGADRLRTLTEAEISARYEAFRRITAFD